MSAPPEAVPERQPQPLAQYLAGRIALMRTKRDEARDESTKFWFVGIGSELERLRELIDLGHVTLEQNP